MSKSNATLHLFVESKQEGDRKIEEGKKSSVISFDGMVMQVLFVYYFHNYFFHSFVHILKNFEKSHVQLLQECYRERSRNATLKAA